MININNDKDISKYSINNYSDSTDYSEYYDFNDSLNSYTFNNLPDSIKLSDILNKITSENNALVNFTFNAINTEEVEVLANVLKNNRIRSINFNGNKIEAKGVKFLADALKINNSIKRIDLWSYEEPEILCDAIKHNKSIKDITLYIDHINPKIEAQLVKFLADAIKHNKSIENITLCTFRRIIDERVKILVEALKENMNIKEIEFYSIGISCGNSQIKNYLCINETYAEIKRVVLDGKKDYAAERKELCVIKQIMKYAKELSAMQIDWINFNALKVLSQLKADKKSTHDKLLFVKKALLSSIPENQKVHVEEIAFKTQERFDELSKRISKPIFNKKITTVEVKKIIMNFLPYDDVYVIVKGVYDIVKRERANGQDIDNNVKFAGDINTDNNLSSIFEVSSIENKISGGEENSTTEY